MKKAKTSRKRNKEIIDYDHNDVTTMIDTKKPLKFEDIGIELPPAPPTQVVSIRLPTELLNQLRALGSQQDVPYQALIKIFLHEAVNAKKPKRSA